MERKIFRKTSECIDNIERVYDKFSNNYEATIKEAREKTDDYVISREPMARLAEVLYTEWEAGAVDLAKHIAVMNGDHYIDGEIKVKYIK
jgi:hypothetical protein